MRAAWQADPTRYEILFDPIGAIAARPAPPSKPAPSPPSARSWTKTRPSSPNSASPRPNWSDYALPLALAGALGAKLSGGGRGGNMLALVEPEQRSEARQALAQAGARSVMEMTLVGH